MASLPVATQHREATALRVLRRVLRTLALALLSVASMVALLGGRARAQSGGDPDDAGVLADRLLDDAVAEYGRGRWAEARVLFERAQSLRPNARTLRGLGYSDLRLHRYAVAIAELEAALVHPERPLDALLREEVTRALTATERYVTRVTVALVPAIAVLSVDGGAPVYDAGKRVVLDLGKHRLQAVAPGHEPRELLLDVDRAEPRSLRVVLQPVVAPPREPPHSYVAQWTTSGAVVAIVLAGTATWWAAERRYAALDRMCSERAGCFPEDASGRQVQRLDRAAYALWSLGGALAVASVALWLRAPPSAKQEAK